MSEGGRAEFSVCTFFPNGSYYYVCRFVTAQDAMSAFLRQTKNVGARTGMSVRVIITDGGDFICAEWKFGEGFTFPAELVQAMKDATKDATQ